MATYPIGTTAQGIPYLSTFRLRFSLQKQGYVASMYAPCMPVAAESGRAYSEPFANGRRYVSGFRATPTGPAIQVQPGLALLLYDTSRQAFYDILAQIDLSNALDSPAGFHKLDLLLTQFPGQNMAMAWEKQTAAKVSDVNNYFASNVTDLAGLATQFNNYGTSNPVGTILDACLGVQKTSGIPSQYLSVGVNRAIWNVLVQHPLVRDQVKFVETVKPSDFQQNKQQLANFFNVKEVFISDAVEVTSPINTALASEVSSFIWPNNVYIFNRDPNPTEADGTSGSWFTAARSVSANDVMSGGAPWRERAAPLYGPGAPLATQYFAEGEFMVNNGSEANSDGTVQPVRSAAIIENVLAS